RFDRCCYLEDLRETLAKSGGVVSLQNKVISAILKGDHHQVKSVSEGINVIKDRVCKHKMLLVIDDIDDRFEFDKVLGKLGDFSSDCRFIFTTRNKRALDFIPECKLYEPGEMSRRLSLQLFCKHAFGMDNPPLEDAGISEEFVKVAGGLPLALKVIGSLLFRRDKKFWKEKLVELQGLPSTTENMVQERLKISYNDLSHNEKQIFLDIACFFIGSHKDLPYYMWSSCDFYPESGINTLIHRSLIKLDEENKFWMHDHIKDLGRAIVNEEDIRHPYNRSRIWSIDDVLNILRNRKGSEQVEVVRIDVESRDDHDKLLKSKNFEKLSGLRYLEVRYGHMRGDFSQVLPNLCCLRLCHCESIPTDINAKKLAVLDLEGSTVKDDWKGWSRIKAAAAKLKAVNLPQCRKLMKSPDLSTCTSLEFINFSGCFQMKGQMHIGIFKNLKTLRLGKTRTTELVIKGGDIEKLQQLEEMDVSGTDLRELPDGMENLSSLKILSLGLAQWGVEYRMEIPRLPGSLKRLSISSSSGVPNLIELKQLEYLSYSNDPSIPGDLWRLPNLKELTLNLCPIRGPMLQKDQEATTTTSLASALPTSLTSLHVVDCWELNELPSLANLCNLTRLELRGVRVAEIRGLGELRALETMAIRSMNLNSLNGLENLHLLTTLSLWYATLERLPSLANLSKLKDLEVCYCPNVVEIPGMGGLGECLSRLTIKKCPSLANLDGLLQLLGALEELTLYEQSSGGKPSLDLPCLVNLKRLYIRSCPELTEVTGLGRLVSLEWLTVESCTSIRQLFDLSELKNLKKLPNLSSLKNLETLELVGCTELTEVEGVEGLESLMELNLFNCRSITELGNLSALKKLRMFDIVGCTKLIELDGLDELEELRYLEMGKRMRARYLAKSAARYGKGLAALLVDQSTN
ncbi:unnamed protein product, partial [Linum tenue]